MPTLTGDHALSEEVEDLYNSTEDAQRLVDAVRALNSSGRACVGLSGPWGGGKTSALRLAMPMLEQSGYKVAIVTAWQDSLAGPGGVAAGLAHAITGRLRGERVARQQRAAKTMIRGAARAGEAVGGVVGASTAIANEILAERVGNTQRVRAALKSSAESRSNLPTVVLVDDVDRLGSASLHELFASIYELHDDDPVVFVLAMDPDEVADRLETGLGLRNGNDYLEKMLNVMVPIAPPSPGILLQDAVDQLRRVYERFKLEADYNVDARCAKVLLQWLRTPRDLRRIVNQIEVTAASASKAELRAEDHLTIQIVAAFDRPFYELLRTHKADLVGSNGQWPAVLGPFDSRDHDPLLQALVGPYLSDPDVGGWRTAVLEAILPHALRRIGEKSFGSDKGRLPGFLANPHYYDRYFHLSARLRDVPDGDVRAAWRGFLDERPWSASFRPEWKRLEMLVLTKLEVAFRDGELSRGEPVAVSKRLEEAWLEGDGVVLRDFLPQLALGDIGAATPAEERRGLIAALLEASHTPEWLVALARRIRERRALEPAAMESARRALQGHLDEAGRVETVERLLVAGDAEAHLVIALLEGEAWLLEAGKRFDRTARQRLAWFALSLAPNYSGFAQSDEAPVADPEEWRRRRDYLMERWGPTALEDLQAIAEADVCKAIPAVYQSLLASEPSAAEAPS
ncbi:KAP family P-loop NTPase fold protein [Cellulomonas endophytica]|uniref:KAP family P-loop NTPase fold protein n=1 Tax=Cellulomonas endophytica TaxID=2494735 RepID=UPI001011A4E7|nr:P-loop NTPase fold protein [Cellulomonas endophytica]